MPYDNFYDDVGPNMVKKSKEKFLKHKQVGNQDYLIKQWLGAIDNEEAWRKKPKFEKEVLMNLGKNRMAAEKNHDFLKRKFLRSQLRRNHILATKFININENNEDLMIRAIISEYQNQNHKKEDESQRHKRLLLEMEENNAKKNLAMKKKLLDNLKHQQVSNESRRTMMAWIMPEMSREKQKSQYVKKSAEAWAIAAKSKVFQRITRNLPKFDDDEIMDISKKLDAVLNEP